MTGVDLPGCIEHLLPRGICCALPVWDRGTPGVGEDLIQDIKDMMKVRVRIPNYSQVCFKVMGLELFSICVNGEGQVITEPYIPTAAERCETDCCEPDTRPFPERNPDGNNG